MSQEALLKALLAAQASVSRSILREGDTDGRAPFSKFVGHEHVIKHVADAMIENRLVLVLEACDGPTEHRFLTGRGEHAVERTVWAFRYRARLYHADGASIDAGSVCATVVAGDKAGYIAQTSADRAVRLRIMACAGADDDPEIGEHLEATPQEQARPRNSNPSPRPSHGGSHDRGMTIKFGKHKGQPISSIDTGYLEWLATKLGKDLEDRSKAKYHDNTRKQLANVEAELDFRKAVAQDDPPDFEPEPEFYPGDPSDEVPF
jgi:hypothetical protein